MAFHKNLLICAPIECWNVDESTASMDEAKAEGADLVELRVDYSTSSFSHSSRFIRTLLNHTSLPSILSLRLNKSSKEANKNENKNTALQLLRLALEVDVEFVELEYEVGCDIRMIEQKASNTRIIVSSYVKGGKASREKLGNLIASMQSTGADVIKLVVEVDCITHVAPIFHTLTHSQVPLIVTAIGSRGLISQLLAPKFGGFLVYASLKNQPVPGLPTLLSLKTIYRLEKVNPLTKVLGLISNPVGHSKSPALHNRALRRIGYDAIYVPLLVDNVKDFFKTYDGTDFVGFSVGIPHKQSAVECCDEVDPLAKAIGAVNTIIKRESDGKLIGYNTDCESCITAIEDALRERYGKNGGSPMKGKVFVLVGAGGAGRALAFGAKSRGARVVIFNRTFERAKALAEAVSGEALPYEYLASFRPESGMILANSSAVGMEPNVDKTPIPKESLRAYDLVLDAVYTPRNTRLLREAVEVGAIVVSGIEMFIRQAIGQFILFTGCQAPEDYIRKLVESNFESNELVTI